MKPSDDYLDVLQKIESVVAEVWREHRNLTNYTVMRVYETAIAYYHAQARDFQPKPLDLDGLDAALFKEVQDICEWCLGRAARSDSPLPKTIPLTDLVACLRKLHKSVEFWTKQGGRQGYLQYIEQFV